MPKDQNAWMQRAGTDGCKNAEEEIQSTLYTSYGDTLGGDLLFVAERNYSWADFADASQLRCEIE